MLNNLLKLFLIKFNIDLYISFLDLTCPFFLTVRLNWKIWLIIFKFKYLSLINPINL